MSALSSYQLLAKKKIHNIHPDINVFFFFRIRQKQQYKHNNTNIQKILLPFARDPPTP